MPETEGIFRKPSDPWRALQETPAGTWPNPEADRRAAHGQSLDGTELGKRAANPNDPVDADAARLPRLRSIPSTRNARRTPSSSAPQTWSVDRPGRSPT